MLEMMRIQLRGLVHLIDSSHKQIVYTNFADTAQVEDISFVHVTPAVDKARFRAKALAFLQSHQDDVVLAKIRLGKQLTTLDLSSLEAIMLANGFEASEISAASSEAHGLGLFVRSLIGLDRAAATESLSAFTAGSTFTGNQLVFLDLLVEQLTQRGVVELGLVYEAPFTAVAPTGPDGLFEPARVVQLVAALRRIRETAEAS